MVVNKMFFSVLVLCVLTVTGVEPECGVVTLYGSQVLIIGGKSAKRGEVPWHVGIYTKTTRPYKQICGGSLISNSVIVSAAHCFWNEIEKQLPAEMYAAAVGKLYRTWSTNITKEEDQRSDVKEIHLPARYQGSEANNQEDIAIVIVTTPFQYTTHVRPICVDFDITLERKQLQPGNHGKVAGWGLTSEDGGTSQVLKVIELPFVDIRTCIMESPFTYRPHITSDKFCAGQINASLAVCRGDSGGGLAFPLSVKGKTRYYLRGVVSSAPVSDHLCNANAFTSFTQLLKHEHFIKQFWKFGYVCNRDGASGTCTKIIECPSALEDIKSRRQVQFCDYIGLEPIVCCIPATSSTIKSPFLTTTERTPSVINREHFPPVYDYVDIDRPICEPIVPALTSAKNGRKAWEMCVEYQEKLVMPCVKDSANNGTSKRVNRCHHNADELVEGGSDAAPHEFPHMALLGYGDDVTTLNWFCEGALISEKFVLTIQACISSTEYGPVTYVMLRALKLTNDAGSRHYLYKVKKSYEFPVIEAKYQTVQLNNIALLELEEMVPLDEYLVPACLHTGESISDSQAVATGWTNNKYKESNYNILQKMTLSKFNIEECEVSLIERFDVFSLYPIDGNQQTCYVDTTKSNDTCQDKSGGPLQVNNGRISCMYTIIGVTSLNRACGFEERSGIYTKVEHFIDWIEEIVWP